ncbi:MAG: bifunctional molybdenum cofactor biosynthesis protein MoaC/MoaB [Candidatus Melainabacteria bacterium]|nr:bifunctional molybdenum cofactor biosynthesis protein MoaC/MoaB [Candidatus Melainabacteria bacterium]
MRDISKKIKTLRTAKAIAVLKVDPLVIAMIKENKIPKGNPLEVAKVAAVQAAKNTSSIIPYCHPLPIDFVGVDFNINQNNIEVTVEVKAIYKTGVEMEALTAASTAALTLYDMIKMLDNNMAIESIRLISKKGGKSSYKQSFPTPLSAAILVMSDSITEGKKDDLSGKAIINRLQEEDIEIIDYKIIPDDKEQIKKMLIKYADDMKLDLVFTTGGTGFSPRDITPEAMQEIIEKEIPGIPEAIRSYGQERTPYSMLSRGKSGLRGKTLIINLPGSEKGVQESLDMLLPSVLHSLEIIQGLGHKERQEKAKV